MVSWKRGAVDVSEIADVAKRSTEPEIYAVLCRFATVLFLAALIGLPFVAGSFLIYGMALCFANSIAVLSVSALMRYGGEISIGHSVFVAIGGYAVAIIEKRFHLSLLVGLPVGTLAGVIAGMIFAFPSRRLSGIYLAVLTMAMALALPEVLLQVSGVTGGFEGLYVSLDLLPGLPKNPQRYYLALIVLVLTCLALARLRHSRQGLALLAARSHPSAAEAFGITRSWARVCAFAISGGLAALSGAVLAFTSSTVSPNSFTLWSGIFLLVGSVVSLHGLSVPAALVGGAFITLIPQYLAGAGDWVPIFYGIALLVVVLAVNCASDLRRLIPLGRHGHGRH
jgi:branched-chain amino acid transport system permease protein